MTSQWFSRIRNLIQNKPKPFFVKKHIFATGQHYFCFLVLSHKTIEKVLFFTLTFFFHVFYLTYNVCELPWISNDDKLIIHYYHFYFHTCWFHDFQYAIFHVSMGFVFINIQPSKFLTKHEPFNKHWVRSTKLQIPR